ncbi:16S rRNA (guanine(966)-N(2))-methyltransferase RsmD [Rarobacter incanus]|uniref:16S rRNA (Guanine966-N2)-methyltransferase n=1 Tax=Rarobacter incanus TaxID=153494 RepID=A0A542SN54_9MICO|nr:16S rRNA (guanine(966)-N(2))-methyltransferase RsmD [Rarobacter incanus]TQK76050.1 16S rRNA (guanine966-N2)-methyltransferase [Rarobacter incanus]
MSRIVAGRLSGRIIKVPPKGTRPTSERVRESLFGVLEHWGAIADANVLDLYAGSGALGFEALSRGARAATLVESSPAAARLIAANASALGVQDLTLVAQQRAESFAATPPPRKWDLVFIDPPYDVSAAQVNALLGALDGAIAADGIVVVERDGHSPAPAWPQAWNALRMREYGTTTMHIAEIPAADPAHAD